jgi:two-component system, sensor histidine kinase RegB
MAVCGQATSILTAHFYFDLDLPWMALIGVLTATVFSNHWFQDSQNDTSEKSAGRLATVIVVDLLLLTLVLHFTGGIHNPFVGFYLLLIAVGAMTLGSRALVLVLSTGLAGLLSLAIWFEPFRGKESVVTDGRLVYPLFLGTWIFSLILIGGCIAFFLHRMNESLRLRDLALAKAEKRIIEANRYQSLATLAAGVAHELGSPLGTIAVASKDLIRDLARTGADIVTQEDAKLIRSEVDRCRTILKRLDRDSTRATGEALQPCTIQELSDRLNEFLPPERIARLAISDRTGGREVTTSVQAILQSLVVLIENACEADPSGGKIDLVARIGDNRDLIFQVIDSGRGITEAERLRIGEPFYTTKKDQSRMGLGLFLIQTLTSNLGGSCTLFPNACGGTCATLIIPLRPNPIRDP